MLWEMIFWGMFLVPKLRVIFDPLLISTTWGRNSSNKSGVMVKLKQKNVLFVWHFFSNGGGIIFFHLFIFSFFYSKKTKKLKKSWVIITHAKSTLFSGFLGIFENCFMNVDNFFKENIGVQMVKFLFNNILNKYKKYCGVKKYIYTKKCMSNI